MFNAETVSKIDDKKLQKLARDANKAHEKGDEGKLTRVADKLFDALASNEQTQVPATYLLSVIAEEKPEALVPRLSELVPLLESPDARVRLNALVTVGLVVVHRLSKDEVDAELLSAVASAIRDEDAEVREALTVVLDQVPVRWYHLLKRFALDFIQQLKKEDVLEIRRHLVLLLNRMVRENVHYAIKIEETYLDLLRTGEGGEVLDLLVEGLAKINPLLADAPRGDPNAVLEAQERRPPLVIVHDLDKVARELDVEVEDVQAKYKELRDSGLLHGFFFLKRKRKKKHFVEYEQDRLVEYLSTGKKSVKELTKTFGVNDQMLSVLIKTLIKERVLKGYLSKLYFYSHASIKEEILDQFLKKGEVVVTNFSSYINERFVKSIVRELAESSKTEGFFDRDGDHYVALSKIMRDIERVATKSATVDLKRCKERFYPPSFMRIKEVCLNTYFTEHHVGTVYLTNLGRTKLERAFSKASQVGYVDLKQVAEREQVPLEIVRKLAIKWFERKNGFWNDDESIFYFFDYLESELEKVHARTRGSEADQARELEKLSEELGLNVESVNARLKAKQERIGEKILAQEEIRASEYMELLGMNKPQFLAFLDSLERPYLEVGNRFVFSPKRIGEELEKVRKQIAADGRHQHRLNLKALQRKYKLNGMVLIEAINQLVEERELRGFWLHEEEFVTVLGVEAEIRERAQLEDVFWLDDVFQVELKEDEKAIVVEVLQDMIERKVLDGNYDPESESFASAETQALLSKNVAVQGLAALHARVVEELQKRLDEIGKIVVSDQISPQMIDKVEQLVEETIKQTIQWERDLKNFVFRRSRDLRELEDDPDVAAYLEDFEARKQAFWEFENRFHEIVALKTRLRMNPGDDQLARQLVGLYRRFGFVD